MSAELALRFVGGVLAGVGAWQIAFSQLSVPLNSEPSYLFWALFATVAGSFGIGFLLTPYVTTRPMFWALDSVRRTPPAELLAGTTGLLVGLLAGALLALPLSQLPGWLGVLVPPGVSLGLAYLGYSAALIHRRDLFGIGFGLNVGRAQGQPETPRLLVDTSAIIDGRMADVYQAGFLVGTLLVPRFILAELQRIADSPDSLRRARGRHGLDVLTRLQKDPAVSLEVIEAEGDPADAVDAQLVSLARTLRSPIVTTDYNLNRVASLQGIRVLNVNELANAVRPTILPGEELLLKIIQEGKEFGQGVGYLDDGTMIVVENGRPLLNTTAEVVVSRVLQTAAGRMIFAYPKASERPATSRP